MAPLGALLRALIMALLMLTALLLNINNDNNSCYSNSNYDAGACT